MWHCIINFCVNYILKLKFDAYFYTITSPRLVNKIALLSVISGFYFLGKEEQEPLTLPVWLLLIKILFLLM